MAEEWRPLVGFEADYSVSSLGRVRRDRLPAPGRGMYSTHTGRILKPQFGGWRREYQHVRVSVNNKASSIAVAVAVCNAFYGPRPAGFVINHIDGDKTNNAAANLEYVTDRENQAHAAAHALKAWGQRHGMVKLTEEQVRAIRADTRLDREVAAEYGVSKTCVFQIRHRITWRHLSDAA